MSHFAEDLMVDDPRQLERLRLMLRGSTAQSGCSPRPPTLEERFGVDRDHSRRCLRPVPVAVSEPNVSQIYRLGDDLPV